MIRDDIGRINSIINVLRYPAGKGLMRAEFIVPADIASNFLPEVHEAERDDDLACTF